MDPSGGTRAQRETDVSVLVVDDEPDVAELVGMYLGRVDEDLSVTVETDPHDALQRARTGEYHCVVSDYKMPEMNGVTLLERVAEVAPETGRLLYTNTADADVLLDVREAGVGYLRKEMSEERHQTLAARIHSRVQRVASDGSE